MGPGRDDAAVIAERVAGASVSLDVGSAMTSVELQRREVLVRGRRRDCRKAAIMVDLILFDGIVIVAPFIVIVIER